MMMTTTTFDLIAYVVLAAATVSKEMPRPKHIGIVDHIVMPVITNALRNE